MTSISFPTTQTDRHGLFLAGGGLDWLFWNLHQGEGHLTSFLPTLPVLAMDKPTDKPACQASLPRAGTGQGCFLPHPFSPRLIPSQTFSPYAFTTDLNPGGQTTISSHLGQVWTFTVSHEHA